MRFKLVLKYIIIYEIKFLEKFGLSVHFGVYKLVKGVFWFEFFGRRFNRFSLGLFKKKYRRFKVEIKDFV